MEMPFKDMLLLYIYITLFSVVGTLVFWLQLERIHVSSLKPNVYIG